MVKKIEVEDYGQSIGDAIIVLSKAVQESMLTTRAIAVLLHDTTGVRLSDCNTIIKAIPQLAGYYTKGESSNE